MTDTPAYPADIPSLMRAAQIAHALRRLEEAEGLYRQILAREPEQAQALGLLAMILMDRPDDAETDAVLQRHLALRPNDGASLHALGQLRARAGDDAAAVALFQHAIQWLPRLAPIHNDLGVALHRLGQDDEALAALERAIDLDGAYGAAHGNRGRVLADIGRYDEAVEALLTALAHTDSDAARTRASLLDSLARAGRKANQLDVAEAALRRELAAGRDDADVIEPLSNVLEGLRRPEEALALRNDLARRTGLQRAGPETGADLTVLVLGGVGAGHIPIRYLLDTAAFATVSVSLLSPDQPDAPLAGVSEEALQGADLVFSTLGDIDRDGGQLAAAEALCKRLCKPVLNPPQDIARTGRDGAVGLFGDIPGLIVPVVERITPAELAGRAIAAPVLVRPAGDHGGDNLTLLADDAAKAAYLAGDPGERLLISPFHDFRSADGHWRKYRLIFVDRKVFPYHLAIGDHWLVHYWRTEMGRSAWKMTEEERFLADWRSVFGDAAAAVDEVARRLDLDYGGMDCALLPDGRVLLFEANACMLLHLDEAPAAFPYKHRYVPPIREAFSHMVRSRAASVLP
jgi:tetratricopeptide (TPR) repeat protein